MPLHATPVPTSNPALDAVCDVSPCTPACENVFDMVHVSYVIRGGTRVMWRLSSDFVEPLPWEFQLQLGSTGNQLADDWADVGLPITDGVCAIDPDESNYGKEISAHYRVKLTTPVGVYYSQPTNGFGLLDARDWRLATEVVRKERLYARYGAQDGYLLKRRTSGPDCNRCLDLQSDEVRDPDCPECLGTGKQCGYYYPVGCVWAAVDPASSQLKLDETGVRGTVQDMETTARMLLLPIVNEYDVWVATKTDKRYLIRGVNNAVEMRGVPLVGNVTLRVLPFSNIVYTVPIPERDLTCP